MADLNELLATVADSAPGLDGIRLVALLRLAVEGTRRQTVKVGIGLIGLTRDDRHRDVLLTLGRHEEFTLHVVLALEQTVPAGVRDTVLMQLGDAVEGWGRVIAVKHLCQEPSPIVKDWLLRFAISGDMLAEMYCSLLIAEYADLAGALSATWIDDPLFHGASEILDGLVDQFALNGSINAYSDGLPAVDAWLRHAAEREPDLGVWSTIDAIRARVVGETGSELPVGQPELPEWGSRNLEAISARCRELLDRPAWVPLIEAKLRDSESAWSWVVAGAARHHSLDPWDAVWTRIQADPADDHYWHLVTPDVTAERLPTYLATARAAIDPGAIPLATHPDSDGPRFDQMRPRDILKNAVEVLARFPSEGIDLIELALRARAPFLRIEALRTLRAWGRSAVPYHHPGSQGPGSGGPRGFAALVRRPRVAGRASRPEGCHPQARRWSELQAAGHPGPTPPSGVPRLPVRVPPSLRRSRLRR